MEINETRWGGHLTVNRPSLSRNERMLSLTSHESQYNSHPECLSHMAQNGIPFSGPIETDGKIHRFSVDRKKNQKDEWYNAFEGVSFRGNHYLICIYGSWSTQERYEYRSYENSDVFNEKEREHLWALLKKEREGVEKARKEAHENAAQEAQRIWLDSSEIPPAEEYSLYLKRKAVKAFGVRFGLNLQGHPSLIIPLKNIKEEIRSIQFISVGKNDKTYKTFLVDGEKRGCFHVLGEIVPTSHIFITEGYSTAATAHEATTCPVIMACDCGNLDFVVGKIRNRYPNNVISIAADDDREATDRNGTPINPGRNKAEKAAKKYQCRVAVPKFESGKDRDAGGKAYTDFNDLMTVSGLEEVKRQLIDAGATQNVILAKEWLEPEPIKSTLFPVPAFDSELLLPEVLRDWVMDEADRMPCPPDFIAAAVVVFLGDVIGARCAIKPKSCDDWQIVPNVWGGCVGLPSSKKSPAIGAAMQPLSRLIAKAMKKHEEALSEYETDKLVFEARKDATESRLKLAAKDPKKGDINQIAQELQTLRQEDQGKPILRRYKSNDTTVEKLGELLKENPYGLLVLRDELVGLLSSWDKAGREGDRSFFLEAWNGNASFDTDRIGRGSVFIPNLCVSIFGGIQPDKLTRYLEQAANALENDGMLQRFQVLVYPDQRVWEWRDRIPDKSASKRAGSVFDALAEFDPVDWGASSIDDYAKFPCFRFDEEAQTIFIEWSQELHRNRLPFEDNPLISQHLAKFDKLFPALALIFHLVDCAATGKRGSVELESAKRAGAWCTYLEAHARRCYGLLADDGLRSAWALASKLSQGKLRDGFTARDVRRNQWRYLTSDVAVQAALDWLEDEKWLRSYEVGGTGPGSGRHTLRYLINPKIQKKDEHDGHED